MPSIRQTAAFADAIIKPDGLLEAAIDWIQTNLTPTDVFAEDELVAWAAEQCVEDVFRTSTLDAWAEANGYSK